MWPRGQHYERKDCLKRNINNLTGVIFRLKAVSHAWHIPVNCDETIGQYWTDEEHDAARKTRDNGQPGLEVYVF